MLFIFGKCQKEKTPFGGRVEIYMKTKTVLKEPTGKAIKRLWNSTVCVMLCTVISLLSLVGCSSGESGEINFLEDDLSKYVYISEEDYKSFPVNDVFYEVGDFDVNEKIVKLLYQNRDKNPLYDGKCYRNKTVSAGDEAYIFYRGYYLDENGKRGRGLRGYAQRSATLGLCGI